MKTSTQFSITTSTPRYGLDEAADASGLHPAMVKEFARGNLIHPKDNKASELEFDEHNLIRLQHLAILRKRCHASLLTLRYVARLMDALEEKEQELY